MARRLWQPLYEALPLLWCLAGLACLGGSYALRARAVGGLLAAGGFVLLVLGLAVWMRRRDYRAGAADYRLRGRELGSPPAPREGSSGAPPPPG